MHLGSHTTCKPVSYTHLRQLKLLPRESIARPAIENNSYIAIMDSIENMFTVMNEVAPEHLEIQLPDPMNYMSLVQNAGSVFPVSYTHLDVYKRQPQS